MKVPHPIPYQGSKRRIARYILAYFPREIGALIEPFAGSAALSIAAACYGKASRFHLNDINGALMALWREIIHAPQSIATSYEQLWQAQQEDPRQFYDHVRAEFNRTQRPDYLLYLLARCVKASVRYNPKGEFNQSPDNRRLGRDPKRMADDILAVSHLFRGRTEITSKDYGAALSTATGRDLVYMDPPYQGVCGNGDPRYYSGIDFEEFMRALEHAGSAIYSELRWAHRKQKVRPPVRRHLLPPRRLVDYPMPTTIGIPYTVWVDEPSLSHPPASEPSSARSRKPPSSAHRTGDNSPARNCTPSAFHGTIPVRFLWLSPSCGGMELLCQENPFCQVTWQLLRYCFFSIKE